MKKIEDWQHGRSSGVDQTIVREGGILKFKKKGGLEEKVEFEKVISLYPDHPTVQQYLRETNSKIGGLEDKTPRFTRDQRKIYIGISSGLMIFSVVIIIALGISNYIDSKRRRAPVILPPRMPLPHQSIQTF